MDKNFPAIKTKRFVFKLDFKYQGTMADCEIKNGKFISLDIYVMINSEDKK
jgi:ribosomal-protein-alanine N-acetyltransferase